MEEFLKIRFHRQFLTRHEIIQLSEVFFLKLCWSIKKPWVSYSYESKLKEIHQDDQIKIHFFLNNKELNPNHYHLEKWKKNQDQTSNELSSLLTYTIDQNTRKDQVEDVEHGSPSQLDRVSDVWIGFWAARVEHAVLNGVKAHQVEFPICLVISHVSLFRLFCQLHLQSNRNRVGFCVLWCITVNILLRGGGGEALHRKVRV